MWFFAVLVVLVLGGIAVVAAGWGQPLAEAYDDRPDTALGETALAETALDDTALDDTALDDTGLPDGPLRGEDLRRVRFPLALRGYRMAEVDALLARLADERDRAPGPAPGPDGPGEPGPGADPR